MRFFRLSWLARRVLSERKTVQQVWKIITGTASFLEGIDQVGQLRAMRRKVACGISGKRVTSDQRRLAAATSEVDLAEVAFAARQRHPLRSAKTVECVRFLPNPFQGMLMDRVEAQAFDASRGRTG